MVLNVFECLEERVLIEQVTDRKAVIDVLEKPVTCYIGFDPTAPSLHVGSLIPIMSLVHMQLHGHRPIALVGGGTGLVGDPSGKTEMRQILSREEIDENARQLKKQLSKYLDFADDKALLLNNADWLTKLNYIELLRDIGRHFSVNRMLAAESYKLRLETGLSFIEFNYMLLQAYDFLYLYEHYDCLIQMGGSDQWGNIVAGVDLVRRMTGGTVYGITFPLITTASGAKMGKTVTGAIWLDEKLTSPYDYYQYWVNTDDRDVARFLAFFTLLPMEEIRKVENLEGEELNQAKTILAYEATRITHGDEAARAALESAAAVFGRKSIDPELLPSSSLPRKLDRAVKDAVPTTEIEESRLAEGIPAFELFSDVGLCKSRSEARRVISQGGGYLNGERIKAFDQKITMDDVVDGEIMLRAGKKRFHRVVPKAT
ncbi:MAG TPA: tyrosine--tRNA ligase [Deltaproteobacteria bacterium]|nr:tyrosine--tRNA ligase [Deltaproteobacteria bacterium]